MQLPDAIFASSVVDSSAILAPKLCASANCLNDTLAATLGEIRIVKARKFIEHGACVSTGRVDSKNTALSSS